MWHGKSGPLIEMLITHIDNFACHGNKFSQEQNIEKLKKTFKAGTMDHLSI